jgi:hypothetical protein
MTWVVVALATCRSNPWPMAGAAELGRAAGTYLSLPYTRAVSSSPGSASVVGSSSPGGEHLRQQREHRDGSLLEQPGRAASVRYMQ